RSWHRQNHWRVPPSQFGCLQPSGRNHLSACPAVPMLPLSYYPGKEWIPYDRLLLAVRPVQTSREADYCHLQPFPLCSSQIVAVVFKFLDQVPVLTVKVIRTSAQHYVYFMFAI